MDPEFKDLGQGKNLSQTRNSHDEYRQCCGSGIIIPDPGFPHPGSEGKKHGISDPQSVTLNLSIFTQKMSFHTEIMVRSRILDPQKLGSRIPDPGV